MIADPPDANASVPRSTAIGAARQPVVFPGATPGQSLPGRSPLAWALTALAGTRTTRDREARHDGLSVPCLLANPERAGRDRVFVSDEKPLAGCHGTPSPVNPARNGVRGRGGR